MANSRDTTRVALWIVLLSVVWNLHSTEVLAQENASTKSSKESKTSSLEKLVIVQEGEIPIIVSAPHGGTLGIEGVPPREGKGMETGPKGFFTGRDGGTQELAAAVVESIEKKFQKKPYAVISATHRKYLDPNRPPEIAFEDPDAKPVYERYHQSLQRFTKEIVTNYRVGLLVDLHGQGSKRDTVFRGTGNGRTVESLRKRFGEEAHAGESSFFGLLKKRGWTVFPDPMDGKEQAGFTGGFIVQSCGSQNATGIDSMQLEFGAEYRTAGARQKIADQLADALYEYSELYIPSWRAPSSE